MPDLPSGRRIFGSLGVPLHVRQYLYDIAGGREPLSADDMTDDELERLRDAMATAEQTEKAFDTAEVWLVHPATGKLTEAKPGTALHDYWLSQYNHQSNSLAVLEQPGSNELFNTFGKASITHSPEAHTLRDFYDWQTGLGSEDLPTAINDVLRGNFRDALEWFGNVAGTQPGEAAPIEITIPRHGDVRGAPR